jgi:hypothetical protein
MLGCFASDGASSSSCAYRKDPAREPFPMLVLLGDYIDRGFFSLNGVLRTVLQLYVTAPELVVVLGADRLVRPGRHGR